MGITVNIYDSGAARPSDATSPDALKSLDAGASVVLGPTETPDAAAQAPGRAIDAGAPSAELVQVVETGLTAVRAITSYGTVSLGGISGGVAPA